MTKTVKMPTLFPSTDASLYKSLLLAILNRLTLETWALGATKMVWFFQLQHNHKKMNFQA
jgi:hypothetical protein